VTGNPSKWGNYVTADTAITIVAYNGVQRRAWNVVRLSELKQWEQLFRIYTVENGKNPTPIDNSYVVSNIACGVSGETCRYYCLGRDFPNNQCWNPASGYPVAYADNGILDALATAGQLPSGARWGIGGGQGVISDGVGPLATYSNGQLYSVWNFFYNTPCPSGTDLIWTDNNASRCEIKLK
jgi:hypothetical protein